MLMIMIYNDLNIMLVPFCILIACIDTWLLLASVRWLLSRFHSPQPTRIRLALQELTDPVPELLGSFLSSRSKKNLSLWVPWIMVIVAALLIRHMILAVIVQTS